METWPVRAHGVEELMVIPWAVACPHHGLGCILGAALGLRVGVHMVDGRDEGAAGS